MERPTQLPVGEGFVLGPGLTVTRFDGPANAPARYLVLSVASVLFSECQVVARAKAIEDARSEVAAYRERTKGAGELAIVQVVEVV